ncbi:MFS transporter [Solirubrobacter ginsenosidimutans]|uniref:MFS transporter n=1 Tax=Solirubrobacter ginsenosidimutans TaxID=490573 RepID=A0A9X3N0C7_9ACTN|nr:MFS transporter [Solirubrobacter ginsenosidimutans]MDA0166090.1 MFS transporter [Solirubrobacter ginsenosidimutans]
MPARWGTVAAYAAVAAANQLLWLTYAPITTDVAQHFDVSESAVGWLSQVFPLLYVVLALPAGLALDRRFRSALLFGAWLTAVGGAVRLSSDTFAAALAGQILIAVAQPLILNAVTKIALVSVPDALAKGISLGSAGIFAGTALALPLGPALGDAGSLTPLLVVDLIVAVAAATWLTLAMRGVAPARADLSASARPDLAAPTHADLTASAHADLSAAARPDLGEPAHRDLSASARPDRAAPAHADLSASARPGLGAPAHGDLSAPAHADLSAPAFAGRAELRAVWGDRAIRRLAGVAFLGFGVFVALTTWLQALLEPAGVSDATAGWLLGAMVLAGVVGSAFLPELLVRSGAERRFLRVAAVVTASGCVFLALAPGAAVVAVIPLGVVLLGSLPVILELTERRSRSSAATAVIWLAGNAGGIVVAVLVQTTQNHPGAAFSLLALTGALVLAVA